MGAVCRRICPRSKDSRSEAYREKEEEGGNQSAIKFEILVKNVRGISLNCVKRALIRKKQRWRSALTAARRFEPSCSSTRLI